MRIFSHRTRSFILAAAITGCIVAIAVVFAPRIPSLFAPNMAPMMHIKSESSLGCFWLALQSCYTTHYYQAKGDMQMVIGEVAEALSKNGNYSIQRDESELIITYKDATQHAADKGFAVDFITAPGPTDEYWDFFIPTDTCHVGSRDCVQARVIE